MTGAPWTDAQRGGYRLSLGLTLFRLALAPAVVMLARTGAPGMVLALVLVAGFTSDILDGVVARRAGAVTPMLRRLDSAVDTVFYLGIAYATYRRYPAELRALGLPILIVLGAEGLNYAAAYARFRREASYHARSARLWGLLLFLALFLLLATGNATLLPVALAAGMVAQLETAAITLVLPQWRHDVPSVWNARRSFLERTTADTENYNWLEQTTEENEGAENCNCKHQRRELQFRFLCALGVLCGLFKLFGPPDRRPRGRPRPTAPFSA